MRRQFGGNGFSQNHLCNCFKKLFLNCFNACTAVDSSEEQKSLGQRYGFSLEHDSFFDSKKCWRRIFWPNGWKGLDRLYSRLKLLKPILYGSAAKMVRIRSIILATRFAGKRFRLVFWQSHRYGDRSGRKENKTNGMAFLGTDHLIQVNALSVWMIPNDIKR